MPWYTVFILKSIFTSSRDLKSEIKIVSRWKMFLKV